MKKIVPAGIALCALACATSAYAQGSQVLWKLVDKKGRVTYVDQVPKDFDGVVTKIEVPLDARSTAAPSAPASGSPARPALPSAASPGAQTPGAPGASPSGDLAKAKARLEEARKAYDAGKEPGTDDVVWVGRKGGGARPEISESYAARVKKLEDAVRAAEQEVERLERGPR